MLWVPWSSPGAALRLFISPGDGGGRRRSELQPAPHSAPWEFPSAAGVRVRSPPHLLSAAGVGGRKPRGAAAGGKGLQTLSSLEEIRQNPVLHPPKGPFPALNMGGSLFSPFCSFYFCPIKAEGTE